MDTAVSVLLSAATPAPGLAPRSIPAGTQGRGARVGSWAEAGFRTWLSGASRRWLRPGLALEERDTGEKALHGGGLSSPAAQKEVSPAKTTPQP